MWLMNFVLTGSLVINTKQKIGCFSIIFSPMIRWEVGKLRRMIHYRILLEEYLSIDFYDTRWILQHRNYLKGFIINELQYYES